MTCIVGVVKDGKVHIGGDSAGTSGWDLTVRADAKVFVAGDFLIGFTSSFRMGQLLRYSFQPPKKHQDKDVMAFMVTDFVDAVRQCLKSGGYARKDNEAEQAGTFLVGYVGRLFRIESDYQVAESVSGYDACGCGQSYAIGALAVTQTMSPDERVHLALHAAERHCAGVRGPFNVEVI